MIGLIAWVGMLLLYHRQVVNVIFHYRIKIFKDLHTIYSLRVSRNISSIPMNGQQNQSHMHILLLLQSKEGVFFSFFLFGRGRRNIIYIQKQYKMSRTYVKYVELLLLVSVCRCAGLPQNRTNIVGKVPAKHPGLFKCLLLCCGMRLFIFVLIISKLI